MDDRALLELVTLWELEGGQSGQCPFFAVHFDRLPGVFCLHFPICVWDMAEMRWPVRLLFRPKPWLSHDAAEKSGREGPDPCAIGKTSMSL